MRRKHVHHVEHQLFESHPQTSRANFSLARQPCYGGKRVVCKAKLYALILEELLILLDQGVLWGRQYLYHRRFIEFVQRSADRETADELRN